jgi:putative nucleotidyltransferase with HDIG domain
MNLEKVREIVEKEAHPDDWKSHILPVVRHSRLLAEKLGSDPMLAELAALLHDIGRIRHGGQDHDFKPGDVVFMPAGEEHQFRNTGDEPLSFLCLVPADS